MIKILNLISILMLAALLVPQANSEKQMQDIGVTQDVVLQTLVIR